MTTADRRGAATTGAWVAAAAGAAAIQIALFWPGIMVWDAIRQYRQSVSGRYDDWHPPAMNWLWRQLIPLHDGPGPMLVLQALLYWSGFALIALAAWRKGHRSLAVALAACALLPIPLFLVGTILKDSLMAGALLLATGLLAIRSPEDRLLRMAGILLLIAAATLRFNAVPACLPLLVAFLPARWRNTRARLAIVSLCGLIPLLAAMPLANRLLHAERSGVELSLVIYDFGGITKESGVDAFPPVDIADPVGVNARCYSPISWDSYAWWGADPCPIGFENLRPVLTARGQSPYRLWASAIVAHPLAYARHRLAHFNNNVRFMVHDADLPALSLRSDPNPWNYQVPPSPPRDHLGAIATWWGGTPPGWPATWLAIGLAILILLPALPAPGLITPITLSTMLYGLSYLPLSVASEVRYHFWTMSGLAIAAVLTLSEIARGRAVPRWRIVCAAAVPLLMAMVGIAARLT